MQVPTRRYDKMAEKPDPYITQSKYDEMTAKLEQLLTISRPKAAEEVKRLAEMGDFSENAAYQIAKGRLRGINQRILSLQNHLKTAEIIKPKAGTDMVSVGSTVLLEVAGQQKQFTILGSSESNPAAGVISYQSPLGTVLMQARVNQTVVVKTPKGDLHYKVLKIY